MPPAQVKATMACCRSCSLKLWPVKSSSRKLCLHFQVIRGQPSRGRLRWVALQYKPRYNCSTSAEHGQREEGSSPKERRRTGFKTKLAACCQHRGKGKRALWQLPAFHPQTSPLEAAVLILGESVYKHSTPSNPSPSATACLPNSGSPSENPPCTPGCGSEARRRLHL